MRSASIFRAIALWLAAVLSAPAWAQAPVMLWAVTTVGTNNKSISLGPADDPLFATTAMRVDGAGNVVVVGASSPFSSGGVIMTLKHDASGNELWRATLGPASSRDDDACCLALDSAGNIFAVGTQNISSGFPGVVLVKYNAAGQEQWRSSAVAGSRARGIAVDATGDVYVASTATGGGYVATKITSAGGVAWSATIAGVSGDMPFAIAVDAFGQAHITGRASNGTDTDYFTVKYNPAGTELWHSRMNSGSGKGDYATGLAIDAAGNVFVTGSTDGGFASDFATVKYSAGGTEIWRRTLNSPGGAFDTARAIALDASGNVYVAGSGQNTTPNDDFITVKYSSAGTELWRALADSGGGIHDEGFALAVDAAQNVYVTGFGNNHLGGPTRGMTVKYNSAGSEVWRLPLADTGSSSDNGKAVAVDIAGNVYVGGTATRAGNAFGSLTLVKYSQTGPTVPGAPVITATSINSGSVGIQFQPPVSTGGSVITQYTAICGALPAVSGPASPLTVTGLVLGVDYGCAVTAGNAIGTSAPSAAVQVRWATVPDAPTGLRPLAGDGLARLAFSAPGSDGGSPVLSYTATCSPGAISATASGPSLVIPGLTNGQSYACSVVATNTAGSSAPSGVVNVTPGGFTLTGVVSRKTHVSAGMFDLAIDPLGRLEDRLTVEPRALGTGHEIVFQFSAPVLTVAGVAVSDEAGRPVGESTVLVDGGNAVVSIRAVPENQRARIQLTGVNAFLNVSADVAFLAGNLRGGQNNVGESFHIDAAATAAVSAADIIAHKSARAASAAIPVNAANFIFDVNTDGTIDARDLNAIRLRSGLRLR